MKSTPSPLQLSTPLVTADELSRVLSDPRLVILDATNHASNPAAPADTTSTDTTHVPAQQTTSTDTAHASAQQTNPTDTGHAQTGQPSPADTTHAPAQQTTSTDTDNTSMIQTEPHIPGALPVDIEGVWSDPTSNLPHQRPRIEVLEGELRRLGINPDSHVVIYEQGELFNAPRIWFLLRWGGFENVSILQGGLGAWAGAGLALETMPTALPAMGTISLKPRPQMFMDEDEALAHVQQGDRLFVDARARGRFEGTQPEPRPGLRNGHMPGARNVPYQDVQEKGTLLPVDDLHAVFDPVLDDRPIVASCGSGLTACVLALGLYMLGRDDVTVYDGSWTQWGREDGPVIETGSAR